MNRKKIYLHLLLLLLLGGVDLFAQPQVTSWYTKDAGKYARIWPTIEDETAEKDATDGTITSVTTWDRADYPGNDIGIAAGDQLDPVYGGVQGIATTATDVYISSTGLPTHTMGPWYDNIYVRDTLFASFPGNAALIYRFPLSTAYGPEYVSTSEGSNPGNCGLFVNGVPLYNTTDTFGYDAASGGDGGPGSDAGNGDGYWNRDAFTNEGPTFDSGNSHQAMESHHYHASPTALRHVLGDSVAYDPTVVFTGLASLGGTSPYTENFNGQHSPILGWVNDGLPMYGPYGYSDPMDPDSAVRLMVTGYQDRDGTNGSYDLNANGRALLPEWVVTLGVHASSVIPAGFEGPAISSEFVLGRYMEDYAFKGDLVSDASGLAFEAYMNAATQGGFDASRHYDLNRYNTRYCVTPEFPDGTWAYFTAIEANGDPVYPYNLAPAYFGDPTLAGTETDVPTGATMVFAGATSIIHDAMLVLEDADEITVAWDGIEGGIYRLDTSLDLETWDESRTPTVAGSVEMLTVDPAVTLERKFYRLIRTGVSDFDETAFGSDGGGGGPGGGGPGGGGPPGGP